MSLLTVENLSHTFGDRTLFKDVSFRLLAEDHVGLVGVNGAGKSTLMNIMTKQLISDSGKVDWTPNVQYGYLDQHTALTPGKTIRDILKDAFFLLDVITKDELKRALQAYKGTIVIVCHEPEFYEGWITKVWNVEEWSEQLTH